MIITVQYPRLSFLPGLDDDLPDVDGTEAVFLAQVFLQLISLQHVFYLG